jgi:homoserine kinase type II
MALSEAQTALADYDLEVADIQALTAGSVNSNFALRAKTGERFFVRVYEEQGVEGAATELMVIRELAERGVPTPTPLPRRDGHYVGEHRGKPVGVLRWVDGEILCFGRLTPDVTRSVGRALGRVHRCSSALTRIPAGRFGLDGLRERLDRVDRTDTAYAADTRHIRERIDHHVARSPSSLPQGLIHGDLFRDNVLWSEPLARSAGDSVPRQLLALLDFESASAGVFIYDLMVCAHAWCYGSAFDLGLVRALFAGYRQERPLEPEELAAAPHQGALAALRFATTRLTDFSLRAPPGQAPARDYRRFLARLDALENGVLSPIIEEGLS